MFISCIFSILLLNWCTISAAAAVPYISCYTGTEASVDESYEDPIWNVKGDVCDHEDPILNEMRNACYFFVKSNGRFKRSCMHDSLCPNGDGVMGCKDYGNRIACCCKTDLCNDYHELAEQFERRRLVDNNDADKSRLLDIAMHE
eukprot:174738_1